MKKIIVILFLISLIFGEGAKYLIITADTFYNTILPLAHWKTQKGLKAFIAPLSLTGRTPDSIKNFILNAYNNWEPRPEYLLLVGSPEFLPSYFSSGIYTDNYYADMSGDYRAEILYGRLPCRTSSQCSTMIRKILIYEKEPLLIDSLWMVKGTGIVREDYDPPDDSIYWSDIRFSFQHMGEAGFIKIDTFSRVQGDNADSIINACNDGRSIVLYRGQGVGNWYSPFNVNPSLVNNFGKYPIIGSFTCQTLTLAPNESMVGERWLRVGNYLSPKGAVAFFGNTHSGSNIAIVRSVAIRGFVRSYFSDSFKLGRACLSAKESIYTFFSNRQEYEGFKSFRRPRIEYFNKHSPPAYL